MGKAIYLKVEKELNHPKSKVWETVALGFGDVAKYNPALTSSKFDSEKREGVGTNRHCEFKPKGHIKEEITEWNENESFTLEFTESSVPMGFMKSKFSFNGDEERTLLSQEFWYRMKAPMGWLSWMMKGRMKKTLVTGLDGLEKYLNNGSK